MSPQHVPAGPDAREVAIVGRDDAGGRTLCKDSHGRELWVRHNVRYKGAPLPEAGERWLISRGQTYPWMFLAQVAPDDPPTVTGSRAGADPLAVSLLAALTRLGLVRDQTSP